MKQIVINPITSYCGVRGLGTVPIHTSLMAVGWKLFILRIWVGCVKKSHW